MVPFQSMPGVRHTREDTGVLYLYGSVMHAVQAWERSLATLVMLLRRKRGKRPFKDQAAFLRGLQKQLDRATHRLQRASPSELRRELPDDFDADLRAELEELTDLRDRLAHRFLLEKSLNAGSGSKYAAGTAEELMTIGLAFSGSIEKLQSKIDAAVDALPRVDMPPEVRQALTVLAESVFRGERVDLSSVTAPAQHHGADEGSAE